MQVGFSGNMVQAIQLNAAKDVSFNTIQIHDLKSSYGQVYGMAIWPENDVTLDGDVTIYKKYFHNYSPTQKLKKFQNPVLSFVSAN